MSIRLLCGIATLAAGIAVSQSASATQAAKEFFDTCEVAGGTVEQPPDSNVEICCMTTQQCCGGGELTMCVMCTKGTSDCETIDTDASRITLPPNTTRRPTSRPAPNVPIQ
jgi:hypothetical protein